MAQDQQKELDEGDSKVHFSSPPMLFVIFLKSPASYLQIYKRCKQQVRFKNVC